MKKAVIAILMTVSLFLCVSCGLARDVALAVIAGHEGASGGYGYSGLPKLPAENTMVPERAAGADEADEESLAFFEEMVDTEGLLGSQPALQVGDVEGSYTFAGDGFYVKDTPFMGKDGTVVLGFDSAGVSNGVIYSYTADAGSITPGQVLKEYKKLHETLRVKYGKPASHEWFVSQSVSPDGLYPAGEFEDSDVTEAVQNGNVAAFHYSWNRVGGNVMTAWLFLEGGGIYTVGLTYDKTGDAVTRSTASV